MPFPAPNRSFRPVYPTIGFGSTFHWLKEPWSEGRYSERLVMQHCDVPQDVQRDVLVNGHSETESL